MSDSASKSGSYPSEGPSRVADRPRDFLRLAVCFIEGGLPADDLRLLEDYLRNDSANRSAFVRLCRIYIGVVEELKAESYLSASDSQRALTGAVMMPAMLHEPAANRVPPVGSNIPHSDSFALRAQADGNSTKPQNHFRNRIGWIAIVATAAIAVITALVLRGPFTPSSNNILLSSIHARWASGHQIVSGQRVPDDGVNLLHGLVEVRMQSGALVVVHGPARLHFPSPRQIRLAHGNIVVRVPHTIAGFTVKTKSANIVDLGTEFGVAVTSRKPTSAEVFKGHVAVHCAGAAKSGQSLRILHQGQAVRINRHTIQTAAFNPLRFVRPAAFAECIWAAAKAGTSSANQGYIRWKASSFAISHMSGLKCYYTFTPDPAQPNTLLNESTATFGRYNGRLGNPGVPNSSPTWRPGRWPAKSALQFSLTHHTAVHMRVGPHFVPRRAITIFVWLKPEDLAHTDHIINQIKPEDPRFNLCWLGSQEKPYTPNAIYFDWGTGRVISATVLPKISEWTFLAVTARPDRSVRFYVDGKLASVRPCPPAPKPQSMQLLIGAPGLLNSGTRSLFMIGRIGELGIFNRVLSAPEIRAMYRSGRPPMSNGTAGKQ